MGRCDRLCPAHGQRRRHHGDVASRVHGDVVPDDGGDDAASGRACCVALPTHDRRRPTSPTGSIRGRIPRRVGYGRHPGLHRASVRR